MDVDLNVAGYLLVVSFCLGWIRGGGGGGGTYRGGSAPGIFCCGRVAVMVTGV